MKAMKRMILSCILLLSAFATSYAQDSIPAIANSIAADAAMTNSLEEQVTALYNDGDYRKVIELLEAKSKEQAANGLESSALYYNLGNAYFRVNDMAHARLNYERALLMNPGDRDTRHNIDYLMTKIEDKILVADTFFLSAWFSSVQNLLDSNTWAKVAAVSFILFILCLAVFFIGRYITMKKAAFYIGLVLLVLIIFANVFSYSQKKKIEYHDTAVIMAGSASMMSSPDINSKELVVLHSVTKVTVTKEDHNWLEVELDSGNIGWIQRDKLEII